LFRRPLPAAAKLAVRTNPIDVCQNDSAILSYIDRAWLGFVKTIDKWSYLR
jgi:hypothetical protein